MREMYASLPKKLTENMKNGRPPCPACGAPVWSIGYRINRHDVSACYQCSRCGTKFHHRVGYFSRYKHPSAAVMYAVYRYHTHPTLRQIQAELSRLGCKVSVVEIGTWVQRYGSHRRKLGTRLQNMPMHPRQRQALRRKIREAYS